MGLNCNRRGHVFVSRGVWMLDIRYEVDSERAKGLLNVLKNETVDVFYLDNTYCNPSYDFPTREVAAQQIGFTYFLFT
jgi:hypothetical protein